MSIPKVMGIETEFGAFMKTTGQIHEADFVDFQRMINIVRAYFNLQQNTVGSAGEIENPDRIANLRMSPFYPFLSHHNLLPNGARFYIDGTHLEYSTAECLSARTLVAADKAGEVLIILAKKRINDLSGAGKQLIIYKDNSDRNGHSYGCHENYLVERDAFNRIIDPAGLEVGRLASFLICRMIFTGSGKMGIERPRNGRLPESEGVYQISQRADFIETLLSESTMYERAIVNTRDEPMADERRFGRLHLILGDANLAEVAKYMRAGITSIILKMIEDEFLQGDIIIGDPVRGIKLVSLDLTCQKPVLETLDDRKVSALDLNEEFLRRARDYFSTVQEPSEEERRLLQIWEETISDFRTDNQARLCRRFDWKIKKKILDCFMEAHDVPWQDAATAVVKKEGRPYRVADELGKKDMLYHGLDNETGLYLAALAAGEVEQVVGGKDVANLIKSPPQECRSYLRGRCLGKFYDDIDRADWDSIIFKSEAMGIKGSKFFVFFDSPGIRMTDPAWGGKDDVGEILDQAKSCDDFLKALQELEEAGR